jgi:hypothetical protein
LPKEKEDNKFNGRRLADPSSPARSLTGEYTAPPPEAFDEVSGELLFALGASSLKLLKLEAERMNVLKKFLLLSDKLLNEDILVCLLLLFIMRRLLSAGVL